MTATIQYMTATMKRQIVTFTRNTLEAVADRALQKITAMTMSKAQQEPFW